MRHPSYLVVLSLGTVLFAGPLSQGQAPDAAPRTQVRFVGPSGMQVRWQVRTPDGKVGFSEPALEAPGRFNFQQGAVYRLKLSRLPGFPGVELYPTLEVVAANSATHDYLAHNAVPLELSEEEVRQVVDGTYLVKTVYLPGSTARGDALLVLRLGNRDLDVPPPGGSLK
jgi:hypothetical protein